MTPTIEQIKYELAFCERMGYNKAAVDIEVFRTILAQHEEIERLHSLIIGLINCGDSLISTKGKPHFEDYAYADWKDVRTKANATLAASLTREQSK